MGVEKPYEVERHVFGPPPGPPHALDVEARARALIRPTSTGVSIAGYALRVPFEMGGETAARALRELVVRRFRERRPHADEATWARFESAAAAMARTAEAADTDLRRSLTMAIDGL